MWVRSPIVSSGNSWKEIVADRPYSLCMVNMMSLICQISETCSAQEARAHLVNLNAFCIPFFSASQNLSSKKKTRKQKSEHMATLITGVMLVGFLVFFFVWFFFFTTRDSLLSELVDVLVYFEQIYYAGCFSFKALKAVRN